MEMAPQLCLHTRVLSLSRKEKNGNSDKLKVASETAYRLRGAGETSSPKLSSDLSPRGAMIHACAHDNKCEDRVLSSKISLKSLKAKQNSRLQGASFHPLGLQGAKLGLPWAWPGGGVAGRGRLSPVTDWTCDTASQGRRMMGTGQDHP